MQRVHWVKSAVYVVFFVLLSFALIEFSMQEAAKVVEASKAYLWGDAELSSTMEQYGTRRYQR